MTLERTLFDAQPTRTAGDSLTPWIVDRLIHTGAMTETGLTRRARPRPCPRCRAWTVCGLDADMLALEACCDLTPLTQLGEVLVLATGRRTVELVHTRGRFQLEQRWADHIEGRPAGARVGAAYDVLAEHRCGQIVPPAYAALTAHHRPASTVSEEPGF